MTRYSRLGVWLAAMILLGACGPGTHTATPTAEASPTSTPTATNTPPPTATPVVYPMRLEMVGQFGGAANELALSGEMVFLKVGLRLVTVDVSNPYNPRIVGRSEMFAGPITALGLLSSHALVGDAAGNLSVLEVLASGDLRVIGSINVGGAVNGIAVSDTIAYLAAGDRGLRIIDLSDPADPVLLAELEIVETADQIITTGNLAIIGGTILGTDPGCGGECPLDLTTIVDITDPTSPELLSETDHGMAWGPIAMSVLDDTLYYTDGILYTTILDISDPTMPEIIARNAEFVSGAISGNIMITYDESYQEYSTGQPLTIRDLSNPLRPQEIKQAIPALPVGEVATLPWLAARGRYVYVASGTGLEIYDLGVSPEIRQVFPNEEIYSTWWPQVGQLRADFGTLGSGYDIPPLCVIGSELLVAGTPSMSLADPANPVEVSRDLRTSPSCYSIPVEGGMILSPWIQGNYTFWDNREADSPSVTSVHLSQYSGVIAAVSESRLFYFATVNPDDYSTRDELQIYDISNPYAPRLLGSYGPFDGYGYFYGRFPVIGDFMFYDSLSLDISDPANIHPTDSAPELFVEAQVVTHGDIVFAALGSQLRIYRADDLSTPLAILERPGWTRTTTSVLFPGNINVFYVEDRLYVSDALVGLLSIYDVQDPANPRLLAVAEMTPLYVAAYGDYLYLHMVGNGIYIMHLVPN